MSEDQLNQQNVNANGTKRKVVPTPRRFLRNRSPRTKRSQSVTRVEDEKNITMTATGMSETSREILELMQKARARSLSIPKDDPRLLKEYKQCSRVLKTPNKTPVNFRQTRGISCPKTIQIISDREILSGLSSKQTPKKEVEKYNKRASSYVEPSQSEYTSSCYSSSPSENEYEFDLLERSAELTRKLKLLSREDETQEFQRSILAQDFEKNQEVVPKSTLRKRSVVGKSTVKNAEKVEELDKKTPKVKKDTKSKTNTASRWKFIANWRQFKNEYKNDYDKLKGLLNRCICDLLLLIFMCGLGGMMFKTLEGSFENAYKCGTRSVKRDFIESLWRESYRLREEEWKSLARRKLYEFEDQLHTAHEAGVTSYSGQRSWNFMNSFVYCLTLVTTIGKTIFVILS